MWLTADQERMNCEKGQCQILTSLDWPIIVENPWTGFDRTLERFQRVGKVHC